MRFKIAVVIFAVAVLVSAADAQVSGTAEVDRTYKALDPRTREIGETYLRTDCEVGEVGTNLKRLLLVADTAKPYLVAVQRDGPPSPVLEEYGRDLGQSWDARQRFLTTPEARQLGPQMFEMMKAIKQDQYVKDQEDAIQAKYRERAALALHAIAEQKRKGP